MKRILAVDIGGTNSRFAACTLGEDGVLQMEKTLWLPTQDVDSFGCLLGRLEESGFTLSPRDADAIVVAMAGIVERQGRYCKLSNGQWAVDLDELGQEGRRAWLINDFEAQGFACLSAAVDVQVVQEGCAAPGAPVAVLGAGTGFGKCLLVCDEAGRYRTMPSEGGHALFPFVDRQEWLFAEGILQETGRSQVIGDLVLSGTGLRLLHQFHTGERLTAREVSAGLEQNEVVLEWFARFYGRACRNYALETLALGGVHITGGIAAGNPILLQHPAFMREFTSSDVHGHLLCSIPVKLYRNEESGLWGAAVYAMHRLTT